MVGASRLPRLGPPCPASVLAVTAERRFPAGQPPPAPALGPRARAAAPSAWVRFLRCGPDARCFHLGFFRRKAGAVGGKVPAAGAMVPQAASAPQRCRPGWFGELLLGRQCTGSYRPTRHLRPESPSPAPLGFQW